MLFWYNGWMDHKHFSMINIWNKHLFKKKFISSKGRVRVEVDMMTVRMMWGCEDHHYKSVCLWFCTRCLPCSRAWRLDTLMDIVKKNQKTGVLFINRLHKLSLCVILSLSDKISMRTSIPTSARPPQLISFPADKKTNYFIQTKNSLDFDYIWFCNYRSIKGYNMSLSFMKRETKYRKKVCFDCWLLMMGWWCWCCSDQEDVHQGGQDWWRKAD